jgi:hypothetical protein
MGHRIASATFLLTVLAALQVAPANAAAAKPTALGAIASGTASLPSIGKMPLSGLTPARLFPGICLVHYRVTTTSEPCQAYFDQGLGYFYSYVWIEAARSFETAVQRDPDCALAWWGLARALDEWKKPAQAKKALLEANEHKARASFREQQLIKAMMQEKGHEPGLGNDTDRRKAAIDTIDNLLVLHDDDEEGWYYRAQLAGGAGGFGGKLPAAPFYKALVRVNPLHPGANHELLHFYERQQRPALGWTYAENYIKSSPGLPHAWHMQAHLATRIGRWDKTADRSARAVELERAYHREQGVKPDDDWQFSHHLETHFLSLVHDGRFREAHAIKAEAEKAEYHHWLPWARLALAERDWPGALKISQDLRKKEKLTAAYVAALVYLAQGDADRALPEIQVLQEAFHFKKSDTELEYRLWETQGLWLCRTGHAEPGLKLLARAAERSKDDYRHHGWGNGAYFMEIWGAAALQAGKMQAAEEGFLEALAHDPGSVRGALGMQVLCERQGRAEEAERFAALARRCWKRADPGRLEAELTHLHGKPVATAALPPR